MPTARILGKPEMFVDVGSTINITCVVENAPGNVRWMHKEKVCNMIVADSTNISTLRDPTLELWSLF